MPRAREILPLNLRRSISAHIERALRPLRALRLRVWGARGLRFGRTSTLWQSPDEPPSAPPRQPGGRLEGYFDGHTTGPGIWKWQHYFEVYEKHFKRFVGHEVHLLEVGVYSGGSLDMWIDYIGTGCCVYGVDIEPACRVYEKESVRIFIGDQADSGFWRDFRDEVPRLDIVVDDGGHQTDQQVMTFEALFAHLRPGGVYICEDLHGVDNGFHSYIHGLSRSLNTWGDLSAAQSAVGAIHLYPFLTVIEKRSAPLPELSAPKHGTYWQPFL